MSKEKQINEIARVLCDAHEPCSKCVWDRCDVENTAIRLYNASYRKQSEGEWKPIPPKMYGCSLCGYSVLNSTYNYCPHCGARMKGGAV